MNENKEEKVAAKFKVGDRVQVTVDQGHLVKKGTKFTVTAVRGTHAFYYGGDPNGAGVWEKNLKLVATDFSTVNVGDRVRLTGNDEIHEFVVDRVRSNASGLYLLDARLQAFASDEGWTVGILERAKSELPTEPGYYEVSKYLEIPQVLVLHTNDRWYVPGAAAPLDIEGYKDNTFTRLTPENASND